MLTPEESHQVLRGATVLAKLRRAADSGFGTTLTSEECRDAVWFLRVLSATGRKAKGRTAGNDTGPSKAPGPRRLTP